jgi:GSH-dependent disulfide-bond oxidoreductase
MLKFYFNGAPNPNKVALFLEETGLPCELIPVDTRKGDQFKPEFLKVNPNGKVPAIDDDGVFVFDSNAILLYLGEKTGKFMPANTPQNRAQLLSWLMFVATGLGPYSGQAVHFKHAAPKDLEYAHNRYQYEAHRHYKILDDHLAKSKYMVGDTYTIVDMAFWGWARMAPFVLGDDVFTKYPNVKRLLDEVSARPAAARAIALKDKFTFKAEMDEEAKHIMFGHLKTKAAWSGSSFRDAPSRQNSEAILRGRRRPGIHHAAIMLGKIDSGFATVVAPRNDGSRGAPHLFFNRRSPRSPRSRSASPAGTDG